MTERHVFKLGQFVDMAGRTIRISDESQEYRTVAYIAVHPDAPANFPVTGIDLELAALFVAAPDLLAACKAAVGFFKVRDDDGKLPKDIKENFQRMFHKDPTCQKMLAAIKKAEPEWKPD